MESSRRSFLDTLLFTSLAAAGFSGLAPVPFYLLPPEEASARRGKVIGRANEIPEGVAHKVVVGKRVAIVINDGALKAFDAACTHQGCKVNWDAGARRLTCPCHGAVFDTDGRPLRGPARRPLETLRLEVSPQGDVIVSDAPAVGQGKVR